MDGRASARQILDRIYTLGNSIAFFSTFVLRRSYTQPLCHATKTGVARLQPNNSRLYYIYMRRIGNHLLRRLHCHGHATMYLSLRT